MTTAMRISLAKLAATNKMAARCGLGEVGLHKVNKLSISGEPAHQRGAIGTELDMNGYAR